MSYQVKEHIRVEIPIQWRTQLDEIAGKLSKERGYKVSVPDLVREAIKEEYNPIGDYQKRIDKN